MIGDFDDYPTHDTPEAVERLAEAFRDGRWKWLGWTDDAKVGEPRLAEAFDNAARQLLAALDGWTLVPRVATADWTGSTRKDVTRVATDPWYSTVEMAAELPDALEEIARLRAALAHIQDITKPREAAMDGPHWMKNPLVGGGSAERIWRIADAALAPSEP